MAALGKHWAGHAYGTNTGNLFLEFEKDDKQITGILRFMDAEFGLVLYELEGFFDDTLQIKGTVLKSPQGVEVGPIEVVARLTPEGNLKGTWSTSLETAGTFVAYPHEDAKIEQTRKDAPVIPEQLYTRNISLGSVRLYSDDIRRLIDVVSQDFTIGRTVVTFNVRGVEVSRYVEDFLKDADSLGNLDYLKIVIQEHEAYGINRLVVVELRGFGSNDVKTQGVQESWVIGKAEAVSSQLRSHESTLVTTYKRHGLNLNQAVFFAMLVMMPGIVAWKDRAAFAVAVFLLLNAMLWLHARYIPNAVIALSGVRPSLLARMWPTILSWFVAVTASLAAAVVYYWLTEKAPSF